MALSVQRVRGLAGKLPRGPDDLRRTVGMENATRRLLLGGVMPLWLGAGLADWYLHRRPPQFGLRLKRRDPLSTSVRVTLLVAVTVFGVLPYAEELVRCWRDSPTLAPLPKPAEPATETLRVPEEGHSG
jgi:hypothetical protein